MGKKEEITGAVGARPPADAPVETAQPLTPEYAAHVARRASQNERTLPPFAPLPLRQAPPPAAPVAQAAPAAAPKPAPPTTEFFDPPALVDEDHGPEGIHNQPVVQTIPDNPFGDLPPLSAEDRLRMPAASDSDTPAKGLLPNLVPAAEPDKFDGISRGGFGDVGEAQYFPLSGDELLQLSLALCDTLVAQLPNDLRFSLALTYPRVTVRLRLEVEGHADDRDSGFEIEKMFVPKSGQPGSTPIEIARKFGNEVVFVVTQQRQEVSADGEHITAPDAIRDELGLSIPRKQIVTQQGGVQNMVDVVFPGHDTRAVTR